MWGNERVCDVNYSPPRLFPDMAGFDCDPTEAGQDHMIVSLIPKV